MFKPMRRRNPLLPDDLDYRTPGIGDGIQEMLDPSTQRAVGAFADAPVQQAPVEAKPSLGDRLSDAAASLGAAQAFLDGDFSTGGQLMTAGRARRTAAEKAIAEARAAEVKRMRDREDWVWQERYKRENAAPEYGYEQDNAGNVWRYDKRSGSFGDKPVFIDPNDRQYVQDGQLVTVPNQFRTQGQQPPILDQLPAGAKPIGGPTASQSGGFRTYRR